MSWIYTHQHRSTFYRRPSTEEVSAVHPDIVFGSRYISRCNQLQVLLHGTPRTSQLVLVMMIFWGVMKIRTTFTAIVLVLVHPVLVLAQPSFCVLLVMGQTPNNFYYLIRIISQTYTMVIQVSRIIL
jgi:hypothetical protein